MIDIEYRRSNGRSYMVYKDEVIYNGFDIQMVQQNHIKGLVPLEVIASEGKEQYWYDISGFQALDTWVEDQRVGADELKAILLSYRETLRQCRRYLLDERCVSLSKENVFISSKDKGISFCYMPFEIRDSSESVIELFEYYMTIMDHSDGRGVKNCYDAYEESRKPNALIDDIIVCFENTGGDFEEDNYVNNRAYSSDEKKVKPVEEVRVYADSAKSRDTGIRRLSLGDIRWNKGKWFAKKDKEEPPRIKYVAEPQTKERPIEHPTVLLGEDTDRILGRLIYQGSGDEQSFVISNKEFTIGSSPELDAVICSQAVSRKHARISEKEDHYYIEDLNSKNGTKVNGQWLNYKDYRILRKNDRIKFADCEYLFI